jgi:hypothetical protein
MMLDIFHQDFELRLKLLAIFGMGMPIAQSRAQPIAPVSFCMIFDKVFIIPPKKLRVRPSSPRTRNQRGLNAAFFLLGNAFFFGIRDVALAGPFKNILPFQIGFLFQVGEFAGRSMASEHYPRQREYPQPPPPSKNNTRRTINRVSIISPLFELSILNYVRARCVPELVV